MNKSLLQSAPVLALLSCFAHGVYAQGTLRDVIFAGESNKPVTSKVIDVSGSNNKITGRIHANSGVYVGGSGNYFRTGVVEHVTGIDPTPNFQGKATLQASSVVATNTLVYPVNYSIAEFAPGGAEAAAAQAASKYFHLQGDTQLAAFIQNGVLREGLYYVQGKISLGNSALRGRVTLVATGEIEISGGSDQFEPFTRCLLALSGRQTSKHDEAAIKVSGGSGRFEGIFYAPGGGIEISGSDNVLPRSMLVARGIKLNGSNLDITGTDLDLCGASLATNRPPVVHAGADQATTLPTNTVALAGVVTDDGLPVGATLSATWSVVSGPGPVTFGNASLTNSSASFSVAGFYVLRLTATDTAFTSGDDVLITVNRENHPPVANSLSVTNLEDTPIDLVLTGSDPDGDPLTASVVQHPQFGALTGTPPNLRYTPAADYFGPDSFTFKVTDGALESGIATVSITVLPVNDAPVAEGQSLSTPEDTSLTITLTGSDVDNSVLTFAIVGQPTNGTLAGAGTAWTYTPASDFHGLDSLSFKANDGSLDSPATNILITVISVNDVPLVNAGADRAISLPISNLTLVGSVIDDFYTPLLLTTWSKVSGPGDVIFTDAAATNTDAAFSASGTYVLRLTADDGFLSAFDELTVTVNAPPTVHAGADQTNTLPAVITLAGGVTDDGLPSNTVFTVIWSKVSGAGTVVFADPAATNTTATFSDSGVYVIALRAHDGLAETTDEITLVINRAPIVDAGSDQAFTGLIASLAGSVADDGIPAGITVTSIWSKVNGPGAVTFDDTNAAVTSATFSQPGIYFLRLTATDSLTESSDDVKIIANSAPLVFAGDDQTIALPHPAILDSTVTDDGLPNGSLAISWTVTSGPGLVMLGDSHAEDTVAHFSAPGTYVLRVAGDDALATSYDELTITVLPPNQPPVVSAGQSQLIILPANATLNGAARDDGLPLGSTLVFQWSQLSGPGVVAFGSTSATNTVASFSDPGNYVLQLTASDGEYTSSNQATFVVKAALTNEPPLVSAGRDKVIGLTNVLTLCGSAMDDGLPEGSTLSVTWSVVSGPGTVTFDSTSLTNARASFSDLGSYVLRLTASDGAFAVSDDVNITVYPFNQPPVVDAGPDQSIRVPHPDVLSASGNPTNAGTYLSRSLFSVDRWNNTVGQPGVNGRAHQVAAGGTNIYYAGSFSHAGPLRLNGLGRWDGSAWYQLYDPSPSVPTNPASPPVGLVNDNAGNITAIDARGDEIFLMGGFVDDHFPFDGHNDFTARWTGTRWVKWAFKILSSFVSGRVVKATPDAVYVGGEFQFQPTEFSHGRDPVPGFPISRNIAKWDGTNWHVLGDGIPSGAVMAIAIGKNKEVYAAGDFTFTTPTGVANSIAVWNGTNWAPLGSGVASCVRFACRPVIGALVVDENGHVYATGDFTVAGGVNANFVAKWDGTNWSALGSGLSSPSSPAAALAVNGRDIYVGGEFASAGGITASRAARWNGQFWSRMGTLSSNGLNSSVAALEVNSSGLFVGGLFSTAGGLPSSFVAQWEFTDPPPRGIELEGFVTDDGLPMDSVLSMAWTTPSGPAPATFADSASARTTATFNQLGTHVLRLTASDSDLTGSDELTVEVLGNFPPSVHAGPDQTIGLTEAAVLNGTVADDGFPEGADVPSVWSVINGPGTVTFNNASATNTSARFSAQGTYVLRLTANDTQFSSFDDIVVFVQRQNFPPNVFANNSSFITLPNSVALNGSVSDDGLPAGITNVFWTQVSGPDAVTFSNANAAVTTARFTTAGTYVLRINATDTELTSAQDRTITVVGSNQPPVIGGGGNQPPAANAGPDRTVTTFSVVSLNGAATDDGLPAGNPLTVFWNAVSGPDRVYFADARQASTTVIFNTVGTYVLRLGVNDGELTGIDNVTFTVVSPTNTAPSVFAGPDLQVTRPDAAQLLGTVLDDGLPAGFPLSNFWSKVSGPGNVTFSPNANNQLALASFSAAGLYVLRLTSTDSLLSDFDDVMVTVDDGMNQAPVVDTGPDLSAALVTPAILQTIATDDGLPNGTLQVSWSQVSGPGTAQFSTLNNVYRASFSTAGDYVLRLTADDGELVSTNDVIVSVFDVPNGPEVAITSPADGDAVTAPRAIVGTASSPILQSYQLNYRIVTVEGEPEAAWIQLTNSTVPVVNGALGSFDPTLLLNGIYELQLVATDVTGRSAATEPVTIIVDRNMKVGHFTLSFNDLTIPVAGIPIQVTRTYDSRDKRPGDFGVGWTLDLKNIRLQKNRHLGRAWDQTSTGGLFPTYCIDTLKPRIVTITFPDGRVQKFQFVLAPSCQALSPLIYPDARFVPLANTHGTLTPLFEFGETVVDDQLVWGGSVPGRADFISFERLLNPPPGPADNILFNPDLFEFNSQEGFKYLLSETNGLRQVTDPNGNTITLTRTGIVHSSGLSVLFQRDALDRITNIVDALGHSMRYLYDTNGNLVSFIDRADQTNSFTYDGRHHLLTLNDARGVQAVRNDYDDAGRLIRHTDALGNAISYNHDIGNRLEIITNRLGFVTFTEYDPNGNVVKVTDPLGAVTRSFYDANDNLLVTIDPLGRTNTFTYDEKDNRTSATDPLGNTTRLTYNHLRRITSATDARGNVITNAFDAQGNLISIQDPLGNVITFGYDQAGLPVTLTNSLGHVMRYAYDPFGRLTNEVDALGHATSYARDVQGNLLSQSTVRSAPSGLETLSVLMQHDALGRLTNTVFPDGSSVQTIYNLIGQAAITVDQAGRQTIRDYDHLGRLIRTAYPDGSSESTAYDEEGRSTATTNRLGQVTQFEYDAVGRVVRAIAPDGTSTTNYFDLAGQAVATTDPRGFNTFYGYDAAGRGNSVTNALLQVSQSIYDAVGNVVQSVDTLGRITTFFYDALNRQTNAIFADGSSASTAFDAIGRRSAHTDQGGHTTRFGYDEAGRLRFVTNALGNVTEYRYNELGQQTQQIDANNHITSFEYDKLGRRIQRTLPGLQTETYGYNITGLLTNKTDFNGYSTAYAYDVMNRLTAKIPDPRRGEPTVAFQYNQLGLRTNTLDVSGTTAYRYDNRNRLIEKVTPQGTLAYAYDSNSNLTNIQSSNINGTSVGYTYDPLNRLEEVNDARVGRTTYTYDAVGNLQGFTYPNNVNTFYRYDALNRLTNMTAGKLLTPVAEYTYGLNASGHRISAVETVVRGSVPSTISRSFSYDPTYRLTNETIAGLAPSPASLAYTYDPVGNRQTLQSMLLEIPSASYAYDPNDRLVSDSYDANGNTLFGLGFGQTAADQYDFENRLIRRTTSTNQITITYDGDGNRVAKTITTASGSITTRYLVDDLNPTGYAQVFEEIIAVNMDPAAVTRVYAYGHDLISQDQLIDGLWISIFYGYDGHGSVRYLTDINGNVTDTYDYDAFGNLIAATGDTPNNYRYSGEQLDPDLNLYYLRARYHSPTTGRFWTMDSFEGFGEDPASLHKYTYCGNNPENYIDPSGHVKLPQTIIATYIKITITINLFSAAVNTYRAINARSPGERAFYVTAAGVDLLFAGLGFSGLGGGGAAGGGAAVIVGVKDLVGVLTGYLKFVGIRELIILMMSAQNPGGLPSLGDSGDSPSNPTPEPDATNKRLQVIEDLKKLISSKHDAIAQLLKFDPTAKIGLRGSTASGTVQNPTKPTVGQPWNPNSFDLDIFVQSDKLYHHFGPDIIPYPLLREYLVKQNPSLFGGLRPGRSGVSLKVFPSSKDVGSDAILLH